MTICLRAATRDDAGDMAALVNMAGEGLPVALWARQADHGQDPLDFGAARLAADKGAMSWRNATVATINGQIAGLLITDELADTDAEVSSDTHPIVRPLIRLENMARSTRTLAALAVFEPFRRKGIASKLLQRAEMGAGPAGMSAIVTDLNTDASAFLARHGFAHAADLPLVHADWNTPSAAWVLMRKQLH